MVDLRTGCGSLSSTRHNRFRVRLPVARPTRTSDSPMSYLRFDHFDLGKGKLSLGYL